MTENEIIIDKLNAELSKRFDDYRGTYFYGSRANGNYTEDSDYDVAIIFDSLDYMKQMAIAGFISDFEYHNAIFIDYKLLTSSGKKSIEYLREYVNPVFIKHAIDAGIHYGRI
jgi:predicted nucleotidyltransferase